MSTLSQSVPNLLSGISQQPDNRKRPGQVKDALNVYPDFALGMLKRPGAKVVSKLAGTTSIGGTFFEILRDQTEKSVAQYTSNNFRVWGFDGNVKPVDMGDAHNLSLACDFADVSAKAGVLTTAIALTKSRLENLQSAEQALKAAIDGQKGVEESFFNVSYEYTGDIEESVEDGILLGPDGYYVIKRNGVVEVDPLPTSVPVTLTGNTTVTVGTERTDEHPLAASKGYKVYEYLFTNAPVSDAADLAQKESDYNGALSLYDTANTDEGIAQINYDLAALNCSSNSSNNFATLKVTNGGHDGYDGIPRWAADGTELLDSNGNGILTNYPAYPVDSSSSGANLTVDLKVEANKVVRALINNSGTGYEYYEKVVLKDNLFMEPKITHNPFTSNQSVSQANVTFDSTTGSGTGLILDIQVISGQILESVVSYGSGYVPGEVITVPSSVAGGLYTGMQITINRIELEINRPPYLSGDTTDLQFLTLNDNTFIVNKKKQVELKAVTTHPNLAEHRAHVVIPIALNSAWYRVTIDGVNCDHQAPASAAGPVAIASSLASVINANSSLSYITAEAIGPGIFIQSTQAFGIETQGYSNAETIFAITDTIANTARLPLYAKQGYVIQVINSEDIDIDDMYLEFRTDDNSNGGIGQWYETAKPGLKYQIDPLTMPHVLVSQADGTFTYQPFSWNDRIVGDENTNPTPSFVGNTISNLFFYRNRLGLLSGQNIILSKAGDLSNFWNTTAQTGTDDDPIDISVAGKKPVFLHYVLPTSVGLVLYSEVEQFLLTTDSDVLTPKSAKVNSMSTYECDTAVEAQSLGISQAFISKTPDHTRLFELNDISSEAPPLMSDVTNIIPELIPVNIDMFTASPGLSMASLGTKGTPEFYQYRFFNRGRDQRIVNSWYRWRVAGSHWYQFFHNNTLYTISSANGSHWLQEFDVAQSNENGLLTLPTGEKTDAYLDFLSEDPMRRYNGTGYENKTRVWIPCGDPNTLLEGEELTILVLDNNSINASQNSVGEVLKPTLLGQGTDRYVDLDGDYRGLKLVIGYSFNMSVDLPKIYKYTISGDDIKNDDTSSLIIHRLKFKLGLSGPVDYKVNITGIDSYTKDVTVTMPQQYILNNVNMQSSSTHVVPVYQRNENLSVQVTSNSPFPVSLLSFDWEGKLNQRFYRRG